MANLDHELRSKGIGSSEIAMLIIDENGHSLSPWGGPHKLWRIKTGQELPETEPKPWLERGNALEGWILNRYATKCDARLRRSPGTKQSPKYSYAVDSVDALAWLPGDDKTPSTCVEAKAPLIFSRGEFGEQGTDQVPRQYISQGQWHMGVWGLRKCDYPVDMGTGDIKVYHTEHDEELWRSLLMIAERFWLDHVVNNVPPPVDATEETSKWLSRRLAQRNEDLVDADEDTVKKILAYKNLRMMHDADGGKLELLANEIKLAIGEHKGICLPGQPKMRVTFTETKGRTSFDHDALILDLIKLLPPGVLPPEKQKYMKAGEPYRRLNPQAILKEGDDK